AGAGDADVEPLPLRGGAVQRYEGLLGAQQAHPHGDPFRLLGRVVDVDVAHRADPVAVPVVDWGADQVLRALHVLHRDLVPPDHRPGARPALLNLPAGTWTCNCASDTPDPMRSADCVRVAPGVPLAGSRSPAGERIEAGQLSARFRKVSTSPRTSARLRSLNGSCRATG